ncbi:MAG: DUF2189 domain-containing protein [Paracoccaceae bacterium]
MIIGLYEKRRRLQAGQPVTLANMIVAHPRSGAQFVVAGLILFPLVMFWLRAADL